MNKPKLRKVTPGKKKKLKKEMKEKTLLFEKTPEECMSCDKPFDKQNKEMISEWIVVVREEEEKVNLWCPECWSRAHELLMDFAKERLGDEVQPE
jgi:hypothetical protein